MSVANIVMSNDGDKVPIVTDITTESQKYPVRQLLKRFAKAAPIIKMTLHNNAHKVSEITHAFMTLMDAAKRAPLELYGVQSMFQISRRGRQSIRRLRNILDCEFMTLFESESDPRKRAIYLSLNKNWHQVIYTHYVHYGKDISELYPYFSMNINGTSPILTLILMAKRGQILPVELIKCFDSPYSTIMDWNVKTKKDTSIISVVCNQWAFLAGKQSQMFVNFDSWGLLLFKLLVTPQFKIVSNAENQLDVIACKTPTDLPTINIPPQELLQMLERIMSVVIKNKSDSLAVFVHFISGMLDRASALKLEPSEKQYSDIIKQIVSKPFDKYTSALFTRLASAHGDQPDEIISHFEMILSIVKDKISYKGMPMMHFVKFVTYFLDQMDALEMVMPQDSFYDVMNLLVLKAITPESEALFSRMFRRRNDYPGDMPRRKWVLYYLVCQMEQHLHYIKTDTFSCETPIVRMTHCYVRYVPLSEDIIMDTFSHCWDIALKNNVTFENFTEDFEMFYTMLTRLSPEKMQHCLKCMFTRSIPVLNLISATHKRCKLICEFVKTLLASDEYAVFLLHAHDHCMKTRVKTSIKFVDVINACIAILDEEIKANDLSIKQHSAKQTGV
jgi:hypothetical protein